MSGQVFVLGIIGLTVVLPVWLFFHYSTRWRQSRRLTGEDEALLQELYRDAEKMEERVRILERILDSETPEWRDKQ